MACTIVFPKFIKNLLRSTLQSEYHAPLSDINNGDFALLFQILKETSQLVRVWYIFLKARTCNIFRNLSWQRRALSLTINSEININTYKNKKKYKLNKCIYSRGVLMKILGGGVPSGSPNPGPISDQKMSFSTPVFRPGGGHKTQH